VELGLIGGSGAQVKVKVKSGAGGQNWPSVVRGKWRMRPKLPKSTCAFFAPMFGIRGFQHTLLECSGCSLFSLQKLFLLHYKI
jgi:hypothetical protein